MDLTDLIRKRGHLKRQLTIFSDLAKGLQEDLVDEQISYLELRYARMEQILSDFDTIQQQIECQTDDDETGKEREDFESKYFTSMGRVKYLLERNTRKASRAKGHDSDEESYKTSSSKRKTSNQVQCKLPVIQLPKFSGSYETWLEFRDTYQSLIHEKDDIDSVNKFHYLKASLEGSASCLIQSLPISNENYYIAWDLLCERYNNTRLLINNHVTALFNVMTITKESHTSIRNLIDNFTKNLRTLESLKEPTNHWDTLLIHLACSKLDNNTRREWEEQVPNFKGTVNFNNFLTFLRNRADLLETMQSSASVLASARAAAPPAAGYMRRPKERVFANFDKPQVCPKCTQQHFLYDCPEFLKLSASERYDEVPKLNVCFNCLKPGHYVSNCWRSGCKTCHKRHNSLIHVDRSTIANLNNSPEPVQNETTNTSNDINTTNNSNIALMVQETGQVLLSTALVKIYKNDGTFVVARAVLDNGSTSCYMTEDLWKKLELPATNINTSSNGLNDLETKLNKICKARVMSQCNNYAFETKYFIIPKITKDNLPSCEIDVDKLNIPSNITLADPQFASPSRVDLLLGNHIFWKVLETGRLEKGDNWPVLCETKLGWLVAGFCPDNLHTGNVEKCFFLDNENEINSALTQFWKLDECTIKSEASCYSPEELACEEHFIQNTTRTEDGRFCVRIPLKQSDDALGHSYDKAKKCLFSMEQRLQRDDKLKTMYTDFMSEYESLGDMTKITDPNLQQRGHFLPHHGVLRTSSVTTKLRVVFNGSFPTTTGVSINDIQRVGPTIQDDVVSILLRFRSYPYVFTADVEKMYRRVVVHPDDRHLQQILWRPSPAECVGTYQLNTVTYGTASAPFLAVRCLKELALQCEDPKIGDVISRDFYVDDFISGALDKETADYIILQVKDALRSAGMHLRKWRSNDPELLGHTTEENRDLTLGNLDDVKILGLGWKNSTDELHFSTSNIFVSRQEKVTKRVILSTVSKLFDPLGLVAPSIVQCKILLQKLWLHKLSWDEEVPLEVLTQWIKIMSTFNSLNEVHIPRYAVINHTHFEFHIFTDASEAAYGACLYVRCVSARDGAVVTRLLMAKSRVSPVATPLTTPRLELCGALLGAKLCKKAEDALRLQPQRCVFWTDSTIVLGWLRMLPIKLKLFVRNRVSDILELTGKSKWRHVPTKENPADLVSRGVNAAELPSLDLWWSGPTFLKEEENTWPKDIYSKQENLPEVKSEIALTATVNQSSSLIDIERFSSYTRLIRVTAYVLRFIHNLKQQNKEKLTGFLKTMELQQANIILLKCSQMESFPPETNFIKHANLSKLNIFTDPEGLLRVGGRLRHSDFKYEKKHPVLLSSSHHLTKIIFVSEHKRLLHAGPQALLASIRQCYWPIGGRNLAKRTYHNCILCTKMKGKTITPMMGDLPARRMKLEHPFQTVGVDYAGPILSASKKGRGCTLKKVYVAVFVCFSSRAIHLELVSDLSADGFIATLHRFVSRRGLPSDVYSDNGTQFVGAYNELKRFLKSQSAQISERAANENINFHFVPPYSPHFAGLAEAGVKSTKHHLVRVLGNCHLTFEELCTVLCQIESILNSRPMTPLSSDPDDLEPLTPSHFLIGRSPNDVVTPNFIDEKIHRLSKYQQLQQLRQHYWTRWYKEFISELQQRQKWTTKGDSLKKDMMVVIKDDHLPPLKWRLGRIVATFPGADGISRVADIRTANGIIRRSFSKICPLPVS